MPLIPAFQRRRSRFAAPWAIVLLLITPNPLAEPIGYGAWTQKAEQAKAEAKQRAEQAEAKVRRAEQEKTDLQRQAAQAEAERQRLQQEVDRLLGEKINLKVDPTARQRAQQLEQQIVELQRQAEAAKAAKQLAEEQLAKEKLKAEKAEAAKRRLEAELKQSDGTGYAPHSEPLAPSNVTGRVNPQPGKMTGATALPAVGSTIQDCKVCPKLVVIPPGEFVMGSPTSEKGRDSDEGPQHTVRIGYTLAVGKYEVTFAEWDACVAEGGCTPDGSGWKERRDKLPVFQVSWDDIHQQYLPWLNRKTNLADRPVNQQYRLLTEAEWEYAARAGTTTAFSFGDTISNYNGNYTYNGGPKGGEWWEIQAQFVQPVDSFAPNAWGLYHVHSNVWEFVEDCYKDSYAGAPSDGSAMQEWWCSQRVQRGGSLYRSGSTGFQRSAERGRYTPDNRSNHTGFRLTRMLP